MNLNIEVKIKIGRKEVILDKDEAQELFDKLAEIFGKPDPCYIYPCLCIYPWKYYEYKPAPYEPIIIWSSTAGTAQITYSSSGT